MSAERVHVFGIRHHGPGSARSLVQALRGLRPDCVLIEGPPDADGLIPIVGHADLVPPVALLVYVPADPRRSAFYPFAEYSPELQAMRYALAANVPVRFMDLPQSIQLAEQQHDVDGDVDESAVDDESCGDDPGASDVDRERLLLQRDPLGRLARAAGYPDGERWWDALVESRREGSAALFADVADAMQALRETETTPPETREARREAHMRRVVREAVKQGHERIAVVCGAWHAPALSPDNWPAVKADNQTLKGLKKVKTEAAWTPWTYRQLASESGYGAGIASPAWYELLWNSPDAPTTTIWMTRVARLMRDQDLDASSAQVIDAVRLSETLSAMRGRAVAGLDELNEAALTVVCGGHDAAMRLVRDKLVIGDRLGGVPDDSPMAPLQRDLAAAQKRLRLPAKSEIKRHDFDLRKPIDLERSRLLHRLNLLGVPWGETEGDAARGKGTFHEYWMIRWEPAYVVDLLAASRYGNTVAQAAAAKTLDAAAHADELSALTGLLGDALLADLPDAVQGLVQSIQNLASTGSDLQQLMEAVPALARATRYGDVRETDVQLVGHVVSGVVERVCVGLPAACGSLDSEAAARMLDLVNGVDGAISLLESDALRDDWLMCVHKLADRESAHGLLRGRAVRIGFDSDRIAEADAARLLSLALSRGADRSAAAAWLEGFLSGSGLILLHDQAIWSLVDRWLCGLSGEEFTELLPILRRTFSTFPAGERRQIGEMVKQGKATVAPAYSGGFNHERAKQVLPLIAALLGREAPR